MFKWLFASSDEREKLQGAKRSPKWPSVRKMHLALEPFCKACGTSENLEVHHIRPFWKFPELELNEDNLITLCETPSRNCHLLLGHATRWKWYNEHVREDAKYLLRMIAHAVRP